MRRAQVQHHLLSDRRAVSHIVHMLLVSWSNSGYVPRLKPRASARHLAVAAFSLGENGRVERERCAEHGTRDLWLCPGKPSQGKERQEVMRSCFMITNDTWRKIGQAPCRPCSSLLTWLYFKKKWNVSSQEALQCIMARLSFEKINYDASFLHNKKHINMLKVLRCCVLKTRS